jgi:hypothetical protein
MKAPKTAKHTKRVLTEYERYLRNIDAILCLLAPAHRRGREKCV